MTTVVKFCCEYQEFESISIILTQLQTKICSNWNCLAENLNFIEVFIEHKWTKTIWLYMKTINANKLGNQVFFDVGFQYYQLDRWPTGLVRKTLPEVLKLAENKDDKFWLRFENYQSFGKTIKSIQEQKISRGDNFSETRSIASLNPAPMFQIQTNYIPQDQSSKLNQQFSQLEIQKEKNEQINELTQTINNLTQVIKGMADQQQTLQQKFETQGDYLREVITKIKDQDNKQTQIIEKLQEQDTTISIIKRSIEIEMH